MSCMVCGGATETVLDLGEMPPVCFPLPGEPLPQAEPLRLVACACGLVQLADRVDPERLYRDYWYRSGTNEAMVAELADVATWGARAAALRPGDTVVDIGANDGTLLRQFEGARRVAVEPARTFHAALRGVADWVVPGVFPARVPGPAQLVTSVAMFYDAPDPVGFAGAVRRLLTPGGVWVVQLQDLQQMVAATALDNVCHEHLAYYSLRTFEAVCRAAGLAVFDAEPRAANGGSLRFYVGHPGVRPETARLRRLRADERVDLTGFAARCRARLVQLPQALRRAGTVDLYGASTKAQTLLHAAGLAAGDVRWAVERDPAKVGRLFGGTGIPIVSEAQARAHPADTWLLGIWQFRAGVARREREFVAGGGRILAPLPQVEYVEAA